MARRVRGLLPVSYLPLTRLGPSDLATCPRKDGERKESGERAGSRKIEIDRAPANNYIARMALRDILIIPDKLLRVVSEPVQAVLV